MVSPAERTSRDGRAVTVDVTVDPAGPEDFGRIAELTAGVYRDEGYGSESYLVQLADVAGRAEHAELLVARDTGSDAVVGSVARRRARPTMPAT